MMQVFGSVFSKFENIDFETADGIRIKFKNNFLTSIGFKIFGLPHIGMRLRARKIIKNNIFSENMLDAGCGTGIYSFSLANKIKNIEAVDISSEKINVARANNIFNNINFKEADLCKLEYKKETFDLIICSDVLEHIKNDEKAFKELSRVLKKNGRMLITVPALSLKNKETFKEYDHERPGYSIADIERLCSNNNLELIKREEYSYYPAEKMSELNYNIVNNKILLAMLFYPLYGIAIFSDLISRKLKKTPNGIFFVIRKI